MPIDQSLVGRAFPPTSRHEVTEDRVRTFAEATGGLAQLSPGDHDPGGPRDHLLQSAGRPYPWVEVRIVDPRTGVDVAPGEPGELWTRSAQNFAGYHRQPEATAAAFAEDGWLRTGDIGHQDPEGFLFLLDRHKDMVISGGENVYPAEIEAVLADYAAALEVAVIGVPSEKWGETTKAIVVPRPGQTIDPHDLMAFTRARLAAYKCPKSYEFVTELSRSPYLAKLRTGGVTADRYPAEAAGVAKEEGYEEQRVDDGPDQSEAGKNGDGEA